MIREFWSGQQDLNLHRGCVNPLINHDSAKSDSASRGQSPGNSPAKGGGDSADAPSPAAIEIAAAWNTLEGFGFPPEAVGWPFRSIEGLLPEAIECALDAIIAQREELQRQRDQLAAARHLYLLRPLRWLLGGARAMNEAQP